tara:strand:- start:524 stop:2365 length:1842 start_codon:yes stop_codon:yes gene_type:complete
MSFRASDERYVPYRSVDVPSTNGLTYSPNGNRVIQLEIPEMIGYFDPEATFLKFDLELEGGPDPLVCRPHSAIHSLIQRVVIRDNKNGSLIEEIDDYNTLVSAMMKYANDDPERAKKGISEGTYKIGDTQSQQYWDSNLTLSAGAGAGPPSTGIVGSKSRTIAATPTYNKNTFVMPLRTGLFQSGMIFPNKFASGIRIELHLVRNPVKALCKDTSLSYLTAPVNETAFAGGGGTKDFDVLSSDASGRGNNGAGLPVVQLQETGTNEVRPKYIDAQLQGTAVATPSVVSSGFFDGTHLATYKLETDAAGVVSRNDTFALEADAIVGGGAGQNQGVQISGTLADPKVQLCVDGAAAGSAAGAHASGALRLSTYNAAQTSGFTMSNVSMVVGEVLPSKAYEGMIARKVASGEGLSLDIKSYQVYKHTLPAAITTQSIQLPIVNKRIYSVLSIPTTQENYTDGTYAARVASATQNAAIAGSTLSHLDPFSHALNGMFDKWKSYHWSIDGVIQPERSVELTEVPVNNASDLQDQHHLYEMTKAMDSCGWDVRDLTFAKQYFMFAKAFARYGNTFNATGKDIQLYIERDAAGDYDALIHSFVGHLRRIRITPSGLRVEA